MKYRTKLYIALVGISLVSACLAIGILYTAARKHYFNEMRNKVLSIAATGAEVIDAEALKGIRTRSDEQTSNYAKVKDELRRIRDANRRKHVYVKYVYTLKPVDGNLNELMFQVDAEENPENFFHVGDINPFELAMDIGFKDFFKHMMRDVTGEISF